MKKDYDKEGGRRKTATGIKFRWTTELQQGNILEILVDSMRLTLFDPLGFGTSYVH